jgi:GntR family transcriptional regulator, arabinose operon transcriptional repressor
MTVQPVLTAKYQQIASWVKAEVQAGLIKPGDKLPSESELCRRFSVSRSAVRQALTTLVREGWLESRKGIGTFCTARRGTQAGDLALVCYYAASYIFPGIVTAFERTAQRSGFHVIFNQSEGDLAKERSILKKLGEKGIGGVAIIPINAALDEPGSPSDLAATNYDTLRELMDSGTQVLLVDNNFGNDRFSSIGLDDLAVGRTAARYLFERGHREVGVLYTGDHRPFKLRREGFADELAALGLDPGARNLRVERREDAEEALCEHLARDRPSAFFCANDELAVSLYRAAAHLGLSIPKDISVISVDDSAYAELPGIDLTSISHPSELIGAKAAQILMEGIASPAPRFKNIISIEPVIIERSSVRTII